MDTFVLGLIVVAYLLVIAYLGFKGYKDTKTTSDYLIAGREIHPFVMAVSYGATFISTSAIIGFGGISANFGMGIIWLTFLNIFIGVFIAFIFFGRRTRKIGHHLNAHTFPEFLGKRFNSNSIQILAGAIIFIAMPLYAAVVLIGGARFIENIFEIDFNIALTIFSLIIAAYVIAGGLKGVMYTDALQGSIMFVSMFVLLWGTYQKIGMGPVEANIALSNLSDLIPEKLASLGHRGWTSMPATGTPWWWTLVTSLIMGVGIGVLAQPQLVVRFMTVKSDKELNRAILIGCIFIFVTTGFIYTVGALSNLYFIQEDGKLAIQAVGGNLDLIIPEYINRSMPRWFVYIFMLALLSAGMSTLSSQFHTMGSAIGRDVVEKIRPGRFDKHSMRINRIGIIVAILISIVIGYKLPISIIARGTAIFFGVCAATFLPTYFAGLYWKKATGKAALWSMVVGLISSLFCLAFLHKKEAVALGLSKSLFGKDYLIETYPWPLIDPILIALPLSIIVLVVLSHTAPQVTREKIMLSDNE